MGYIGTFGEELARAMARIGRAPARSVRLHGIADAAVMRHGVGDKAVSEVERAVRDDPALMLEILDEIKVVGPLIRRFIERRAAALKAQGAFVPAGQAMHDALRGVARRDGEVPAADGHDAFDDQSGSAIRLPGHARRGLDSIAAIAPTVARGVLQSTVIDGRRLGEMTPAEAMAHVARENASIARERIALDKRHGHTALIVRICRDLDPAKRIDAQIDDDEAARRAAA